ncbi:MAG: 3-deoxy-D-manno-octulosonic acid transferase [Thermodesulfovibrionales bacterium]
MYLLYSSIYIIVLIFILPFEYFKRPGHIRKRWLKEKFGFLNTDFFKSPHPPFTKGGQGGIIWVHAVSVGEVMASLPLLKRLREKYPSKNIILSTITDTGQKVARERVPEGTGVVYLPFDITPVITAAIKKVKPVILIIIETELWPNLIRSFRKNGTPVILLNGRISENSFRGYKRISFFMKRVLSHIDFFGMQGEEYAERIRNLGVNTGKVMNTGNFKFDSSPPSQIPVWTEKIKGPVIAAGSTHEGEEEFITSVYHELKKDSPLLNLVIAPRHPERFKGVEDMLRLKGISFIKRSAFSNQLPESTIVQGQIILLDTVGELSAIYGISDIAIIGKSFRGYGGQNPLEPAYWGKPIVCGPHMENFPVIRDFYTEGAAIEAREDELYSVLKGLLLSPGKAGEIGSKAQELYRKNAGAVERAMEIVEKYINVINVQIS